MNAATGTQAGSAERPSERLPIGRGERARARVLHAALEVLAESGLPGFTMEAVANRASASKTTLYRRWPSRMALLVDAMDHAFPPLETGTTGDLRSDLLALMAATEALLGSQPFPRLLAAVIDAAERDASLAGLHVELTERRREPVRAILGQAVERGHISPDVDLELVVDLLVGPAFYRRFVAHRPFPERYAAELVDLVLAAATGEPQPSREQRKVVRHSPGRESPPRYVPRSRRP